MRNIHTLAAVLSLAFFASSDPVFAADRGAVGTPALAIADGETDVPGDFNEDGNPDVLWYRQQRGDLLVWTMQGIKPTGRLAFRERFDVTHVVAGTDDFNGDGTTDVLFWEPDTGKLVIWYLSGTTVIAKSEMTERVTGMVPVSVYDFDGDGSPDVLFQSKGGEIQAMIVRNGQIATKVRIDLMSAGPAEVWFVQGSGDFDGDGDRDLVVQRTTDTEPDPGPTEGNLIGVALMSGTTGMVQVISTQPDRNWDIGAVQDYDRDGDYDLIWENDFTGQTAAWVMEGIKIRESVLITDVGGIDPAYDIGGPR